jgi:hypothetical protein
MRDALEDLAPDVLDADARASRYVLLGCGRGSVARDQHAIDVVGPRRDERSDGMAADGDVRSSGNATPWLDVYSSGGLG